MFMKTQCPRTKIEDKVCAFVFCAGLGTRMYPYTKEVPKPLLKLKDGTFPLYHISRNLSDLGFRHAVVNYSYGKDYFVEAKEIVKKEIGLDLVLVEESNQLGHAGGLKNAEALLDRDLILGLNGDTISDIKEEQIWQMIELCDAERPIVVWGKQNEENEPIRVDSRGYILGVGKWDFDEGEVEGTYDAYGVFMVHGSVLKYLDRGEFYGLFGDDDIVERVTDDGKHGVVFMSEKPLSQISVGSKDEYEYYLKNDLA